MNIQPQLSVIIPAYNEERRIGRTLVAMRKYFDAQNYSYEIIVVNDASTDTTVPIVEIIKEGWPNLYLVKNPQNLGKGGAVKNGILMARGKYLLFADADNATPISEIEKLWPFVTDYQVVFGSRHCSGAKIHVSQVWYRIILSRLSNILIRLLAVPGVCDTQCGFKLFEHTAGKNIFANVTINRWGFDFEALMIARRLRYKIKEVGIEWHNDPESKFASREAIRTLIDLFKIKRNILRGDYDAVGYIYSAPLADTQPVTEKEKELELVE
ncbi:MAG: glycosyltransferase family 2 protein [Patescibacteria group bacterium]|nr:glycosyltransferase family 2 protein [Patescibacteria group bacterium]